MNDRLVQVQARTIPPEGPGQDQKQQKAVRQVDHKETEDDQFRQETPPAVPRRKGTPEESKGETQDQGNTSP